MANYTINKEKKVIAVDFENLTAAEEKFITVKAKTEGYEIKQKSAKRSKNAKQRAAALPNKEEILKALETKEEKEEFEKILKDKEKGGFFKARSWYLNKYKKNK